MSNHHLPAGQGSPAGGRGGGGRNTGADHAQANYNHNGGNGGERRRPAHYQHNQPQHQHQHQQYMSQYAQHPMSPMYQNYMGYPPQGYYGMPPQYQSGGYQNGSYHNGSMPSPGYMPYQQNFPRSPPAVQQFVPMKGISVPQTSYSRHSQEQSPALATAYQPPLSSHVPIPPETPSSTHSSSQMFPPPTPSTPQSFHVQSTLPPSSPQVVAPQPTAPVFVPEPHTPTYVAEDRPATPFRAPLPWFSCPAEEFPRRVLRSRRKRGLIKEISESVSLPVEQHEAAAEQNEQQAHDLAVATASSKINELTPTLQSSQLETSVGTEITQASSSATPATSLATPNSSITEPSNAAHETAVKPSENQEDALQTSESENVKEAYFIRPPPTSWANLVARSSNKISSKNAANGISSEDSANECNPVDGAVGVIGSAASKPNGTSLAEAVRDYRVGSERRITFLEPRGLINTGNMCYMNSVLQVLIFCAPFYDFLDQVSKRAAHKFKSNTPLVDAMIMFMHEYKIIRSAPNPEQLRRSLKPDELEKYGEPFTPEFVYEAIRQLSRFASMRRGHQQDAEEFLGFLLQSLDDECTHVINQATDGGNAVNESNEEASTDPSGDWLEVGRKQRAAVTRSAGSNSSTPITKMFGGLLRSEFRVPGLKDSITTEPYQPLQLDIGSLEVRNVIDALRGLTRPERLQGDFNSPRGKDVTATKQVSIETLPPVLILHLKRFQFDAEGNGTVKVWKKVGYPLELEIPREVLSKHLRQSLTDNSMPKYKLISVIYHHGKNATAGHYTADVRRQEDNEWIRLDDTVIRRVRAEDVAEVGSEDDDKISRKDSPAPTTSGSANNRFGAINDEDEGDEGDWKEVPANGGKKPWSSVVNGSNSPAQKSKQAKENIKDNRVAYLLFYQRV